MESTNKQSGFTLIELSIVLTVLALIIGGGLAIGAARISQAKLTDTQEKLETIEDTLRAFVQVYNRLPCPADTTLGFDDANFGQEDRNAGLTGCDAIASAIFSNANIYGGALPTRTLQLPDTFIFDGWDRRFFYIIDQRSTATDAFLNDPFDDPNDGSNDDDYDGQIRVDVVDGNGGSTLRADPDPANNTGAIVAVISFGQIGHGAWFKQGGTARNHVAVNNVNELANSHYTSAGADDGNFDDLIVQGERTVADTSLPDETTFDDIVIYLTRWHFLSD